MVIHAKQWVFRITIYNKKGFHSKATNNELSMKEKPNQDIFPLPQSF